jgi:putative DNA primase/helicase
MSGQSLEDACRLACLAIGVEFKNVPSDGRFHAADISDDPHGQNDARIKVFSDRQGGVVCNWKSGINQPFFVDGGTGSKAPSPEELERIKRERIKRQKEQAAQQVKASRRAAAIWSSAAPAPVDHPYLVRKQVKAHGLRIATWKRVIKTPEGEHKTLLIENSLLVPMFNQDGRLTSLQAIFPAKCEALNRDKDFLPCGGLAGLFSWIGGKTEPVLICEGWATGATLHEETGKRVYVAFSANNLLAAGHIVREKLPDADIIFCADNDENTPGNPGLTKANEAAAEVNGRVAVPPIAGDFNDYAIYLKQGGIDGE